MADAVDTGQLVLQVKFKPGEALKYQAKMQFGIRLPPQLGGAAPSQNGSGEAMGGATIAVNATQDVKVRRAGATGGGDLDVTTTGQNSLPGQPSVLPNDIKPALMSYDGQGKLLSVKRESETASSNPMYGAMLGRGLYSMQGLALPAKPIKVGETWSQSVQVQDIPGKPSSTIKGTLVRMENIGKYRTARLHLVVTTPVKGYLDAALQPTDRPADAASTMTGTSVVTDDIDFAVAEGLVVRSSSRGITTMSVAIGKPTPPAATPKRKKGAAPAPAALPAKPSQILTMTVRSDLETELIEPGKKGPGGA